MSILLWNKYHCFALFGACLYFLVSNSIFPILIASSVSIIVLCFTNWPAIKHLKPAGGFANHITLFRFLILLFLGLFNNKLAPLQLFSALIFFTILDGIDGYIARKKNQQSNFGAIFDQEIDAIYMCVVSCLLLLHGLAGYWLLIPGFLRYFYAVIIDITRLQDTGNKRTRFGPAITVYMFLALASAFVLPFNIRYIVLISGSILVFGSFVYSYCLILWPLKNKIH
jgi:phosphatidylglycerophosphate synthase